MAKHFFPRSRASILACLVVVCALFIASDSSFSSRRPNDLRSVFPAKAGKTDRVRINESFGKLPLGFEANHGQTDESAEFIARGPGYTLFLNSREAIFAWQRNGETFRSNKSAIIHNQGPQSAIRLKLLGSSASSSAEAIDPLPGRSNYFIGNDPSLWRTNVPSYSRVRYRDVYPGVDVVYYGAGERRLEYDFVIAPHSDPRRINLSFEGADEIELDEQGDLLVGAGGEQMRMRKPLVYQEVNGERRSIEGHYAIRNHPPEMAAIRHPPSAIRHPTVGFQIGDYDANQTLIIDPIVDYSTFFGGSGTDIAYGIAVDEQGNVYLTGQTSSPNFPTKNPLEAALSGANDAFVMKLNAQGNTVVFSTYIGGRNPGDRGSSVAVDRAGNVYFTGETTSLNFPTVNAAQPNYRGGIDAFAAKLSNDGAVLLYSTYLGGSLPEVAYSIALDRFDNAYITGRTESLNFPSKNPLQSSLRGQRDAFVTKFSADGEIVFSTYLGGEPATANGRDEEAGYGIALDALSNIYITGFTSSPNFPLINPIQGDFGGVEDAFVTKLNPAASAIVYSTFLGGLRVDNGRGIAVDGQGAAYVTGYTLSSDFPQVNALQPLYGGSGDAFVAKLNAAGTALIYSTFLGGAGVENSGLASDITPSCAITVDSLGHAYVTGRTDSPNFPVVRAIQSELRGDNDAFVAKLDPAGSALIFSTLWGSTFTGLTGFDERGLSIAIDRQGSVYVTGQMLKSDFPTFLPVQSNYGGGLSDAFITKISAPDIVSVAPVSAASFNGATLAPEQIVAAFGLGLANGTEIATTVPLPTSLLGAGVKVRDRVGVEHSAPLFFVSPSQINFQIPPGTATGKTTITIANQPNPSLSVTVWVENTAPGLFAANANGQGVAAAVVLRVRQDGSFVFEPVAQPDGQGQFIAIPIDLGAETDQVFLILFGTGIRNRSALEKVIVQVGGVDAPVLFAGAQGSFVGQDQVNVRLPRTLIGRGDVAVTMTVDGAIANSVSINIR